MSDSKSGTQIQYVLNKNREATRDIADRKKVCDFCYRLREEKVQKQSHGLCTSFCVLFLLRRKGAYGSPNRQKLVLAKFKMYGLLDFSAW